MYPKLVFLFCLLSVDAAPHVYDQSQTGELNVQVDLKDLQIFALLSGKHEEYYEDIDYAYDYSEMTIKPQTGTSKKPLNITMGTATTSDNVTVATTVIDFTTEPFKNNTQETETTTFATKDSSTSTAKSDPISSLNKISVETNATAGLHLRKEDGVNSSFDSLETMEAATININVSDPVTLKPQVLINNITSTKIEIETTTKSENAVVSNVTTLTTSNAKCKKGFVLNQRGGCELKIQSMSNALLKIVKLSQKLKSRRHRINNRDSP
ncbi:uncharacterized protein LOC106139042 [Amyelois transitella]|uniref:uncharacterized protein LOC106139042 n=1 Tax=Amyelois transitella TaxID=680683 RepID=UPI00299002C1|nr:uncharacterized protein LOC106139042 [Amyelois transitella]